MGWLSKTLGSIIDSIIEAKKDETEAYDSPATVLRDDGDILWVHIPGGVDETPIKKTIDAKRGDVIQVRVGGGTAWATGNQTAPPTDDTKAKAVEAKATVIEKVVNTVKTVAEKAYKIAGNTDQFFWVTETGTDTGAHITEIPREDFLADPDNGGGNFLARTNGIAIRDGMAELATFSAEGMNVKTYDSQGNDVDIAHLGYALGESETGTATKPYYTLGQRQANSTIGNYSIANGYQVVASGFASCAEGYYTSATGKRGSHAEGYYTIASGDDGSHAGGLYSEARSRGSFAHGFYAVANAPWQVVFGQYNEIDTNNDYWLIIGGGQNENNRFNVFSVDVQGYIDCGNFDCGKVTGVGNISSGSTKDVNITFHKAFRNPPIVTASFVTTSTAGTFGRCTIGVASVSGTGATLRIFNGDSSTRSPDINWTAMLM